MEQCWGTARIPTDASPVFGYIFDGVGCSWLLLAPPWLLPGCSWLLLSAPWLLPAAPFCTWRALGMLLAAKGCYWLLLGWSQRTKFRWSTAGEPRGSPLMLRRYLDTYLLACCSGRHVAKCNLGSIWKQLCSNLGLIWEQFGSNLGSMWE